MSHLSLSDALRAEQMRFLESHPRSVALSQESQAHFLFGLPMHWMQDWPMPCALHIEQARGSELVDVDGHRYVDFCLGDTGAMFGHSPPAWMEDLHCASLDGITAMLPSHELPALGRALTERFGLSHWQLALSASDANRFLLRWCRAVSQRRFVLVFDGCYHGAVDDTLVDRSDNGHTVARPSILGQVHNHHEMTRVVPFNDLHALEIALRDQQVACVLAEPALTNCGMVLPKDGFWAAAQDLCQQYGTLLCMDETHTVSSGLGGYCQQHGLIPDALVMGKAMAGGWPCAVYGVNEALAKKMERAKRKHPAGHSGIGTTLSGGLLTVRALKSALVHLHTPSHYEHMLGLANRLVLGLRERIQALGLPWQVTPLGARLELQFLTRPAVNAQDIRDAENSKLEAYLHLFMINRGFVLTPFHNMLLCAPSTTITQVDRLLHTFDEWFSGLNGIEWQST